MQSELPNPVNFAAATETVREEDMAEAFGYGPDVERHVAAVRGFVDAGFDHLCLINAGPDPEGFFRFFEEELSGPVRALED